MARLGRVAVLAAVCVVVLALGRGSTAVFFEGDETVLDVKREALAQGRLTQAQFDAAAASGDDQIFLEAFENQKNCMATNTRPEKPRSLSFCHKFNDEACCVPTLDKEDNEMFDTMTDLGLSCRLRGDVRGHALAKLYCMNCDPQQPQYIRNQAYTALLDGSPSEGRDQVALVCRDWAEAEFGTDPLLDLFNRCGIMKSSPCLDGAGTIIPDRDRFVCGDDLVIPSISFARSDTGDLFAPVEAIEAFLNADSVGPPLIDENVGFLLVEPRACTETEFAAAGGTNPLRCLLTQSQLGRQLSRPANGLGLNPQCSTDADFKLANPDQCASLRDEICFSSAASLRVSFLALALCFLAVLFL